jgi:hypothetical protein
MSNMHTPDEQRNNSVTQSRLDLREAGYSPIPVRGKRPLMNGWQTKHEVGRAEIERWEKNFPDQQNTGLLTRTMPTLDVDILDERAATRVQAIAYARFANRGHFLVRVGMPPKRAIPFRTDAPFCKIRIGLYGPNDDREKPAPQALEFLCDGQQVVCHGVHPDTGKPYTWANGHPPNIKWSELPPSLKTRLENSSSSQRISCARSTVTRERRSRQRWNRRRRSLNTNLTLTTLTAA